MQLWVRIFPDECLVDTFEATLTESEVKNATIFWSEYFHAAGVESAERAAWRVLVGSHGSGRATWIIRQFRPLNPLSAGGSGRRSRRSRPSRSPSPPAKCCWSSSTRATLRRRRARRARDFWAATW